jgi:heme-degrading monooxygenase HmoA
MDEVARARARWAVIFTSEAGADRAGYAEMDAALVETVHRQPGFCGVESIGDATRSITVSYWDSEEAIRAWRDHAEHRVAQSEGRSRWYSCYHIEVCRIERRYAFEATPAASRSSSTS